MQEEKQRHSKDLKLNSKSEQPEENHMLANQRNKVSNISQNS